MWLFSLCGGGAVVLQVHTVKVAVIFVTNLHRGGGGRRALGDKLTGGGELFMKDIL